METKWNDIKNYLKCVRKNEYTLVGSIGLVSSLCLVYTGFFIDHEIMQNLGSICSFPSLMLLTVTTFGSQTFKAYKKMNARIARDNTIDEKAQNAYKRAKEGDYCCAVGMKMAAKENGLENLL